MSNTSFSSINLKPELVSNLTTLGYSEMTPIQAQSLPLILANKDLIGQGQTGSGKTAAFGLGLLQKLDHKVFKVQSMVICPTRELADQVANEIRRLARAIANVKVLTLCGGTPSAPQRNSLEHGVHIVVGTPGRILDHLERENLDLSQLTTLVLDEADRMLEMGFEQQIDAVIEQCPQNRQTLLFSATYPRQIESIAKRVMKAPVMVEVASTHSDETIEQHFYKIDEDFSRVKALRLLLQQFRPQSTVVFCNTKKDAQQVSADLLAHGFSVSELHGDLEQKDRDQTLVRFANGSVSVLVATDVAARGLDIDTIDAVINYHVARDSEVHTHRIGRTGRAGNKGIACSIYTNKESYKMEMLEAFLALKINPEPLPDLKLLNNKANQPNMTTLQIDAGKKQKIRPGDILGALTGNKGLAGKQVGKIHIFERMAYVAVTKNAANQALQTLNKGRLKGRSCRCRIIKS